MTPAARPRVLIVEDDPINLRTLVELLAPHYQTLVAKSGEEALKRLSTIEPLPDLVLLDIMLPGISGYQVCAEIKESAHTAHLPVVFLTAMTDTNDEERGFAVGGVDFIHKPFHASIVLARVRNHVELKLRGDLLEQMSTKDPLTGLYNRRRFDQFLEFEWRRAIRHQLPLAIILMDIDHFKLYNDHYGHPTGDGCLVAVATTLRGTMKRSIDFVGRYGGEEFVCVLPETTSSGALALGEKIRKGVAELKIPHLASPVTDHITMSLGIAAAVPTKECTPLCLLEMADAALYTAKQAGRDQVVVFNDPKHPSGCVPNND